MNTEESEQVYESLAELLRDEPTVEVSTPDAPPPPPEPEPEEEKSPWEQQGYLSDIARAAEMIEELPEKFVLPSRTRQAIETVNNAKTVADFANYTERQLDEFVQMFTVEIRNAETKSLAVMRKIETADISLSDVDFI